SADRILDARWECNRTPSRPGLNALRDCCGRSPSIVHRDSQFVGLCHLHRARAPAQPTRLTERGIMAALIEVLNVMQRPYSRRTARPPTQHTRAVMPGAAAAFMAIEYRSHAQQAPATPAPIPPILQNYQPVTAERLKNPEPGNWLMIRRTYDGWGFSPLEQ